MWTSSRNKILFSAVLLLLSSPIISRALPIDSISVFPVGPSNVGANSNIQAWVFDETINVTTPTPSEVLTFQLYDGTQLIPNGISLNPIVLSATSLNTDVSKRQQTGLGLTQIIFYHAGTNLFLRATTASGVVGFNVNPTTAIALAPTKLVVVGPGQTLIGGTNTPDPQVTGGTSPQPNDSFNITVYLTDIYFNKVPNPGGDIIVTLTPGSVDGVVTVSNPISNGADNATFTARITGPSTTVPFSATGGGLTPGETNVTSSGPEQEKVFAFPSPFNPKQGQTIKFRFLSDAVKSCTLKVTDQFGQRIWEKGVTSLAGDFTDTTWDGKNSEGTVVAAGIYYVLLEVGGELKSKERFGVKK